MQIVPTILPGSYPSKVTQPDGYNPSPLPPPTDYYVSKKEILDNFLKRNPSVPEDTIPTFDSEGQLKSSSKTIEGLIDEITAKVTDGATEAYDTLKEIEAYITEDKSVTTAIMKNLGNLGSRVTNLEKNGGVVAPSADASEGQAADAKATYEALEAKADKSELSAEVERAKEVEGGLDERVTELEENGGGASVTVDDTLTQSGENPVKSKGIWSAIWGAIAAPATSVYAWVTTELGKKQDKLKEGDNITIAEDGTISASGGAVDVVAEIAGKEIRPSSVVMENGDNILSLDTNNIFRYKYGDEEESELYKYAEILRVVSNISFILKSILRGDHKNTLEISPKGLEFNAINIANDTHRTLEMSVWSGAISYAGPEGSVENTIANMVNAMPRYPFVDADWVEGDADIDVDGGKATWLFVKKYHNSYYNTPSSTLQALLIDTPEGETSDGLMRDAVLIIDMPEGSERSVVWFMDVHPRGGDAANLEVVAGKRNVFFITEVQPNQFMVARDELALPDEGGGE